MTDPTSGERLRQHPQFLRVWGGQGAGAVADQILPVALSLYAVQQGGGTGTVAAILAGRAVALVVCLLASGILADRSSRVRILVTADLLRAGTVAATLATLVWLPLPALAMVTALCGAAEALSRPALRSLIPLLLPPTLLERGNALVSLVQRGAVMAGALAGAALVAMVGARVALGLAMLMFAVGALALLGIRSPLPGSAGGSVLADATAGLAAVRQRPWVMAVMGAVAVQLFAGTAPTLVLLPFIARDAFGGELAYGVVLAALAAGALPAIAVASRWRPTHPGTVSMLALVAYAVLPLTLAVPLPLPVTAGGFALGGFAVELYFIYWLSALQRGIPTEVLGKVMALDQLSAFALLPLGYALAGPVIAALGARPTLLVSAVLVAAAPAVALAVPGVARFGAAMVLDRVR